MKLFVMVIAVFPLDRADRMLHDCGTGTDAPEYLVREHAAAHTSSVEVIEKSQLNRPNHRKEEEYGRQMVG